LRLSLVSRASADRLVKADASRVRQVLLNLISNAIKFTSAGEVTVVSAPHGGSLRIAVSDTGMGIPDDQKSRMFERFSQADASTTRRFGGTGLGLSISRQLVELMGGTMGFESREGAGSMFWMELPLSGDEAPAGASIGPDAPGAISWASKAPVAADSRVLLVEDNFVNQKVAAGILKKLGYEVDIASNGLEAVEMARRNGYRVILMDCQMPEMDGFVATQEIRSWEAAQGSGASNGITGAGADAGVEVVPPRRSFIVALTASAMTDERDRCRDVGMDAFLAKPFDPRELHKLLASLRPD
jgi:two-component system, sensor histidine kinase